MSRHSRKRWTNDHLERLDQQIVIALEKSRPQSVRHVFYLMTDPRLECPVDKTETGYKRVQRRCVDLRRAGRMPYDWIVDMTRRGHHTPTYDNPASLIRSHGGGREPGCPGPPAQIRTCALTHTAPTLGG